MSEERVRMLTLGGIMTAILVRGLRLAAGSVYELATVPSLLVLLGQFMAVKLVGDMVYYRLRPQYKDYGLISDYVGNDFLTFLRFAFPGAVVQRMTEYYVLEPFYLEPWLSEVFLGPWLPTVVFMWNRFLRERAADRRHTPGERLIDLP